jgi:hypothetical protein
VCGLARLIDSAKFTGSEQNTRFKDGACLRRIGAAWAEYQSRCRINGRGPFPLMFDTGAVDAVTPETAAALGLKSEGTGTARDSGGDSVSIAFTRVATVQLGDAEMTDQPFAVHSTKRTPSLSLPAATTRIRRRQP